MASLRDDNRHLNTTVSELVPELTGTSRYRILSRDVSPLTWNKIAAGLEALAHEANRLAPDADAFKRHATIVADALKLQ